MEFEVDLIQVKKRIYTPSEIVLELDNGVLPKTYHFHARTAYHIPSIARIAWFPDLSEPFTLECEVYCLKRCDTTLV